MGYFRNKNDPDGLVIHTDCDRFWSSNPDYEKLSDKVGKAAKRAYAKARLLEMVKPGDTIYSVLRHVSASGMSRRIDLYVMRDNEPRYLSGYAADVLEWSQPRNKQGIVVSGCGMDMGFHLVYSLGACLWPDGTPEPHGIRNGEPDSAGGYALKHRWL